MNGEWAARRWAVGKVRVDKRKPEYTPNRVLCQEDQGEFRTNTAALLAAHVHARYYLPTMGAE